jgi:zinc finger protein
MECGACGFKKADVEAAEQNEPAKWSFSIENDEDLNVRIVKSSEATVKLPHIVEINPGSDSEGYITNVEGLLQKVKHRIEASIEDEEDKEVKKQGWKLLKKLNKALVGREKLKLIIEDPSGNSAILSDKAEKKKLK